MYWLVFSSLIIFMLKKKGYKIFANIHKKSLFHNKIGKNEIQFG